MSCKGLRTDFESSNRIYGMMCRLFYNVSQVL